MLKAIESELYRIVKSGEHDDDAYYIEVKEVNNSILVFKEELDELIELLEMAKRVI